MKKIKYLLFFVCCIALPSFAAESLPTQAQNIQEIRLSLDSVWVVLGGILVFFMQAGFALIESGSVRSKNTINVLMKNSMDACLGGLVFWLIWLWFDVWCQFEWLDRDLAFCTQCHG